MMLVHTHTRAHTYTHTHTHAHTRTHTHTHTHTHALKLVHPVCVSKSMLFSHAVLTEVYQEKSAMK